MERGEGGIEGEREGGKILRKKQKRQTHTHTHTGQLQ